MNLASFSIAQEKPIYLMAFLLAVSGILSYLSMGWLEDPDVSVKAAVITIQYPGATPIEVEQEIVEIVETKLQEMPQLKHVSSLSSDGRAIIKIEIKDQYWSEDLPQVWDEMRRKIRDIEPYLPEKAGVPIIRDDFGSVFGFVLALTSDGFEQHELDEYAKDLRRELNLLPQVARIDLWGNQQRQVFIDLMSADISEYGITALNMAGTFQSQGNIVDAGMLEVGDLQYVVNITGELNSLEDIGNMLVAATNGQGKSELVRLGDVAKLRYGYLNPPPQLFRNNGAPAVALAIAPEQSSNIVVVGRQIEQRLKEIQASLPVGIEIEKVAWQSDYVGEAISGFMVSLLEAILIVFLVLSVTMGIRMGVLIGGVGLGLTVLGSISLMHVLAVDLHRISLGALIVAMGMMVDNAIVVADGFVVRVREGMERREAAQRAAEQPGMPLLGATLVAVMAFYPIFGSSDGSAEYARALFIVVGLSLILSWVISQTLIPLLCVHFIPVGSEDRERERSMASGMLLFRRLLSLAIRKRVISLLFLVVLMVVAVGSFPLVKQMFFPLAERNQFMIDYWGPQGRHLPAMLPDIEQFETKLLSIDNVKTVSSFIGQGPPRFYLPVDPELPSTSYAQLLVTTAKASEVDDVITEFLSSVGDTNFDAMMRVRKFGVGSSESWPINIRVIGPADADTNTLRIIAEKISNILRAHPNVDNVNSDWRQRRLRIQSKYSLQEGGWTGVSRDDVARSVKGALDGTTVSILREGDERYPIVVRVSGTNEGNIQLPQIQVGKSSDGGSFPLAQINKESSLQWYDPIIWRYDLRRTISVRAQPVGLDTLSILRELEDELGNIDLPAGYQLKLAGEYQASTDAIKSLLPGIPVAVAIMAVIIVVLFNGFRPVLMIFSIVPFAIIGVVFGHILTGVPLGFISVLGIFSLSGMMIKNAVVLLDQININVKEGSEPYEALISATESRLIPVFNASLTTILGMLPLLGDVFWQSMAISIMCGLIIGTILTMIIFPVLYAVFYRVEEVRH